jgi:phosphate transport system protein
MDCLISTPVFLYPLLTMPFGVVNFNGLSYGDAIPFKRKNMPRKSLDHQLHLIRDDLLLLSSMVETALEESVIALKDYDTEKSRAVYKNDMQINDKRFEMEWQIMAIITIQSPILFDLRFLASALNICTKLERIGDYAKTIARINLMSESIGVPRFLNTIQNMGFKTSDMLHRSMTAFIHTNAPAATRIISDDDMIDAMYTNLYTELMEFVTRNAYNVERVNYLLWAAHNLERAADRVTNICERTIYIETGELGNVAFSNSSLSK